MILEKFAESDSTDSLFAKWAVRDGDWNTFQKMAKETHLEAAKLRSAFVHNKGGEGEDVKYYPFETPVELRTRLAEMEENERDSEPDIIGSLFGN